LGALVLPLIPLVDSMTVVNLLQWSHTPEDVAKLLKGAYDRGQPLIQFGTFFATSLSLALVPAISEAVTKKQMQVIANRTEVAIRLTLLLGLPASFGLALLVEPINIMLYGDTSGTEALAIQSFTILFATLSIATSGILQGLGEVTLPARHLLIGVVVKLVLNLALIPLWGISGAAMSTVLAYVVAMALNMMAIRRHIKMKWNLNRFLVKPTIAVLAMSVLVMVVEWVTTHVLGGFIHLDRMLYTLVGLAAVMTGGVVYLVALLLTGGISVDDLRMMPKGKKLLSFFTKVKLVRP
jgi:PST family polysaccharide transporter